MNPSVRTRHFARGFLTACVIAALTGCSNPASNSGSSVPVSTKTEAQRITASFAKIKTEVAKKDGSPSDWSKPILAAKTTLKNGRIASLWVADNVSPGLPTHGYYLDITSKESTALRGVSSWTEGSQEISIENRSGNAVVGDVGSWDVTNVGISNGSSNADVPVTKGYFLIPSDLTSDPSSRFTITLLDQWGMPFGVASDLSLWSGGKPITSISAIPAASSGLLDCMASAVSTWPVRSLTAGVRTAAVAYYKAKKLLPITIYKNSENVLDVEQQRLGFHWCNSGDGGIGGYAGSVPMGATEAVMIYVHHAPYPIVDASDHFLTVALISGDGWKVVGEGTGP
ncbi:MAG TPA: hypothetical protein VMV52_09235 [Candidatus Nanopelagicaceae bacterium]|nr:hypothetical protein [Candidatus Nanopelagicaceae bacterium]